MARSVDRSIVVFHRDGEIAGVGFLVGRRGVLTCAHVINTVLGRDPLSQQAPDHNGHEISVTFPLIEGHPNRKATVVGWLPPPSAGTGNHGGRDVAHLEFLPAETRPGGARGLRFTTAPDAARVRVYGYPGNPPRRDGGWVAGTVQGRVASGLLQIDSNVDGALRAQPGYSGSPVVRAGRVVGMFASASVRADQRDGYAIPPGWLRQAMPSARGTRTARPAPGRSFRHVAASWHVRLGIVLAVLLALVLWLIPLPDGQPTAAGDCVPLQVSVSTEKDELLAELAEAYNAADRTFDDGGCATVATAGLTSGTAMTALAEGWPAETTDHRPRPQVWLPTSSMWTDLLREAGHGDLLAAEEFRSVTSSVLAIAMRKPMADALLAEHGEVGWADILELARPGQGWAAVGHPEWGKFVLGRDNPHYSTSGLAATVATYFAAADKQRGITAADLSRGEVIEFVHGIESSVIRYGPEATTFMQTVYDEDQNPTGDRPSISAVVIQEQLAFLYNQGAPTGDLGQLGSGKPNVPLVAVQPKEGTVALDHPFVVLSSASEEQRAAAEDFLAFLTEDARQQRFVDLGFRTLDQPRRPTELLTRTVGVPADVEQRFYELPDPPLIKAMQRAWDGVRRKARVLLLLDVSTSMNEDSDRTDSSTTTKFEALKPAAKRGLELLGENDQVAIWTFADEVSKPLEMSRVGDVEDQLDDIVDGLRTANNTALHAATAQAHDSMLATIDHERINAIVLLSDGRNHPPDDLGREQLLNRIDPANLETSVRVFTIPYGADADFELLSEIAGRTKAQRYNASPRDIDEVMVAVFSNFG